MSTSSFSQSLTELIPPLRAFARSLCGDASRADDLVQEALLKAWNHRDQYQPGTNLRAWLFTILRNQFYSEIRHRKFEVADPDGLATAKLAVKPAHDVNLHLRDLQRALDELPDDQREALLLVTASGLSYEEAAEVCECAVGTIKSRISRARDRLVGILGPAAARVESAPYEALTGSPTPRTSRS
jgi:RNA polymerase sigma-70 factor (ECF subfamily)